VSKLGLEQKVHLGQLLLQRPIEAAAKSQQCTILCLGGAPRRLYSLIIAMQSAHWHRTTTIREIIFIHENVSEASVNFGSPGDRTKTNNPRRAELYSFLGGGLSMTLQI
jgi:hypothetical protein